MINAIATKAISQAFNKSLKDAVLPFTGSRKGFGGDGGVYDPIRDEYVSGDGSTGDISYTGRGAFGKFSDSELLSNGINITDTKLTCLVAEVSEIPKVVRHRIDGLENFHHHLISFLIVRHRIDGLENNQPAPAARWGVRHRIDGLETLSST